MTRRDDYASPRDEAPGGEADGDETGGNADGGRPDWWRANERLREAMGLSEYRPPRFADGTYTHRVVEPLEAEHGCRIRFVGVNTRYPEDWAVRVDGEPAFGIGRRRDEDGNTVYELSADAFVAAVERAIGDGTG